MKVLSYDQALQETMADERILILGNGFSVAWDKNIFSYKSLKQSAKGLNSDAIKVFSHLNTSDFEEVINAFDHAATVCEALSIENSFRKTASKVRDCLIETIATNHPANPDEISEGQFNSCILFLKNFKNIFTLNYDMLLYWVMMKDKFRQDGKPPFLEDLNDGFAYNSEEFLNWDGSSFNIHYLHGALHLFEYEELKKLNYKKTSEPLKRQFIKLISTEKKFPLFVSEGSTENKLKRIRSSGYLTRCLNSLQKIGKVKSASSVFIFGASLSAGDTHVLHALGKNKCKKIYIGLHGDPSTEHNQKIVSNSKIISSVRSKQTNFVPLSIQFYDSTGAKVWGQ